MIMQRCLLLLVIFWSVTAYSLRKQACDKLDADIIILGGGIAGITARLRRYTMAV